MKHSFDAAYYARFYGDPTTCVHDATRVAALGRGITGFAEWFGLRLGTVLEVGAGTGLLRDWFAAECPRARYVSTEFSEHAAERYHHTRMDLAAKSLPAPLRTKYDLVVCQGVLQYLDDTAAELALERLALACGGLLYLEAITRRDLDDVCDPELTDMQVYGRTGAFYEKRLAPHFEQVGAGLRHRRGGPLTFYELERAPGA